VCNLFQIKISANWGRYLYIFVSLNLSSTKLSSFIRQNLLKL